MNINYFYRSQFELQKQRQPSTKRITYGFAMENFSLLFRKTCIKYKTFSTGTQLVMISLQ